MEPQLTPLNRELAPKVMNLHLYGTKSLVPVYNTLVELTSWMHAVTIGGILTLLLVQ